MPSAIGGHLNLSIINFLCCYKKNNEKRQQKEFQLKFSTKRLGSRKAVTPKCGIGLLIKENS